jgi:hypothetical protein
MFSTNFELIRFERNMWDAIGQAREGRAFNRDQICAAVLQSMSSDQRKELTPIKLRKKAAQFAVKTVDAQREQFKVGGPLQSLYQFWL